MGMQYELDTVGSFFHMGHIHKLPGLHILYF